MKLLPSLVMSLGFIPCILQSSPALNDKPETPDHYCLVWSDNFAEDSPGLPDPTKWDYEYGYVRNHEAQFYTRGRLDNARVENGCLIIEARKDNMRIPGDPKGSPAPYTSASLITQGKADWQYGRFEIRARMPSGKGCWPALWTLGTSRETINWPRCGEIDLVEIMYGQMHQIRGNFHYEIDGKHVSSSGGNLYLPDSDKQFHTYAIEWTPLVITLSVDGKQFAQLDTDKAYNHGYNPYQHPHYLILNLALGGSAGGPIDDSALPQRMEIQSVKIYQLKP